MYRSEYNRYSALAWGVFRFASSFEHRDASIMLRADVRPSNAPVIPTSANSHGALADSHVLRAVREILHLTALCMHMFASKRNPSLSNLSNKYPHIDVNVAPSFQPI